MTDQLLTEYHLEFLSLTRGYTQARMSLHLSKYNIVGNHMSRHKFTFPKTTPTLTLCFQQTVWAQFRPEKISKNCLPMYSFSGVVPAS